MTLAASSTMASGAIDGGPSDRDATYDAEAAPDATQDAEAPQDAVAGQDAPYDAETAPDATYDAEAAPDATEADASQAVWEPPRSPIPSCNGVDGLGAVTVLEFVLDQGARPDNLTCYPWTTKALTGLPQVTLVGPCDTGADLTCAAGQFVSSTSAGCSGSWTLSLGPDWSHTRHDVLASVPEAGASGDEWVVTRSIDVTQPQLCGGLLHEPGEVLCRDTFVVEGIAEVQ